MDWQHQEDTGLTSLALHSGLKDSVLLQLQHTQELHKPWGGQKKRILGDHLQDPFIYLPLFAELTHKHEVWHHLSRHLSQCLSAYAAFSLSKINV